MKLILPRLPADLLDCWAATLDLSDNPDSVKEVAIAAGSAASAYPQNSYANATLRQVYTIAILRAYAVHDVGFTLDSLHQFFRQQYTLTMSNLARAHARFLSFKVSDRRYDSYTRYTSRNHIIQPTTKLNDSLLDSIIMVYRCMQEDPLFKKYPYPFEYEQDDEPHTS